MIYVMLIEHETPPVLLGKDSRGQPIMVGDVLLKMISDNAVIEVARHTEQLDAFSSIYKVLNLTGSDLSLIWRHRTLAELKTIAIFSGIRIEFKSDSVKFFDQAEFIAQIPIGQLSSVNIRERFFFVICLLNKQVFFISPDFEASQESEINQPSELIVTRELVVERLARDFGWIKTEDIFNSDGNVNSQLKIEQAQHLLRKDKYRLKRLTKYWGVEQTNIAQEALIKMSNYLHLKDDKLFSSPKDETADLLVVFFAAREWARWIELAAWYSLKKDQNEGTKNPSQKVDDLVEIRSFLNQKNAAERRVMWLENKERLDQINYQLAQASRKVLSASELQIDFDYPSIFATDETFYFNSIHKVGLYDGFYDLIFVDYFNWAIVAVEPQRLLELSAISELHERIHRLRSKRNQEESFKELLTHTLTDLVTREAGLAPFRNSYSYGVADDGSLLADEGSIKLVGLYDWIKVFLPLEIEVNGQKHQLTLAEFERLFINFLTNQPADLISFPELLKSCPDLARTFLLNNGSYQIPDEITFESLFPSAQDSTFRAHNFFYDRDVDPQSTLADFYDPAFKKMSNQLAAQASEYVASLPS